MSWGSGGWGISPWGGGADGSSGLVGALAIATRTVRVTAGAALRHIAPASIGDALNPASWAVVRLDTGDAFTILTVATADGLVFDLSLLENLGPYQSLHRVFANALDKNGLPIGIPTQADFAGLAAAAAATPQAVSTARGLGLRDIANPQASGNGWFGGTLQISAAGGYAAVEGPDLLRKLIIRRLTTSPGEFYHLPNYGLGLREKEPIPIPDLTKLRREIERQIALEPEVDSAQVTLLVNPAGVVTVSLRVKTRQGGQNVGVDFQLPQTAQV